MKEGGREKGGGGGGERGGERGRKGMEREESVLSLSLRSQLPTTRGRQE